MPSPAGSCPLRLIQHLYLIFVNRPATIHKVSYFEADVSRIQLPALQPFKNNLCFSKPKRGFPRLMNRGGYWLIDRVGRIISATITRLRPEAKDTVKSGYCHTWT